MNRKIKSLAGSLVVALLLLGGALALLGAGDNGPPPVLAATQAIGGPDDFGYVYTDSLTTPALYNWVDIAAGGTPVGFADPDTAVKQLNLPGTFTFYGNAYSRLYVTTNGYVSFRYIAAGNVITQCQPTAQQPPDSLAALCTDLVGDTVYYSTTTAYNGHQTFIIQYDSVTHTASGLTTTFQIVLDFEDDAIIYQYQTAPVTAGVTTTVGIIGYASNTEDYLIYCQGTEDCPPQDALAVRFSLSSPPLLELSLTPGSYFPDVGDTITYTLVLSNSGAPAPGAVMTNALPAGLNYLSGTLQATAGASTYQDAERTIHWTGDLATSAPVTLTYAATLDTGDVVYNRARLSHPLARRAASAVSSPAEPWDDPGPVDAPHKFDQRLGSWRHIAVDDVGTLHVAYAGAGLYYATLNGTTWLSETVPGTGSNLWRAALTLDEQNRALIAYYGQQRLWLARQTDAGWTVEEIAYIGYASDYLALDLTRGSDGSLHLVYNELGNASTNSLYYTAYNGAGWLTPTVAVAYPNCYAYNAGFSLALNADDVPHVACTYRGSTPRELRVYTYTAAAPWTDYSVVASSSDLYNNPSLAFDGNTPHLAFFQGSRALYHAEHDGADWQVTLVDNSAPTSYLQQGAALDIGGGQVGILGALRAGSSGNYTMTVHYAARPLTETTWLTGTVLTLTYGNNDPCPTLALDKDGRAHLAYYDSRDQTLRYVAEADGFAPTMADESRSLRAAAVALGVDGAIHVAWDSKGLRYAVGAADIPTWTRQMAVPEPGVSNPALALAVDGAGTPHLLYGRHDTPLYHATPSIDSTWITRVVDLPGDVTGFDISAEVTGTAHVAYIAAQGGEHVLRHAAFDGAAWLTETLAVVSPATWNHDQKPQIVAQGGQVYVLYADCTQNPDNYSDYPIALQLATWNGSAWAHDTLYEFVGQCDWQLTYQLAGDADGRLSAVAHINSDAVRPRPLVVTFWIADAAGQRQVTQRQPLAATGEAGAPAFAQPAGVQAPAMMSYIIQAMLRGDGGMATWIEYGIRLIQQWDREGNLSGRIPAETGSRSVAIEDGAGDGERSVVVERWEYENELRVPRSVRRPCAECCLITQTQPEAAATAGCTAAPPSTQGACGAQVEVTADACEGWKFTHWSGAATGSAATTLADMIGVAPNCSVATANFTPLPTLTLNGHATLHDLCPHEALTTTVTVFTVTLAVDDLADWEATAITFQGSGTGNEQTNIERVELYLGSQLLSSGTYNEDDGQITLDIGQQIPAGASITLHLVYTFQQSPVVPWPVQTFDVTTQVDWVEAEPVNPPFDEYEKLPPTPISSGPHLIAAVRNVNTRAGFETIQGAINAGDTQDGHSIAVCPGAYTENVLVDKALTLFATEGREATTVQAQDVDADVFHTTQSNTTLEGLTIRGASNARGVLAEQGVTVRHADVTGNSWGIYSLYGDFLAEDTEVYQNAGPGLVLGAETTKSVYLRGVHVHHNQGDGIGLIPYGASSGLGATRRLVIEGTDNQIVHNGGHGIHAISFNVTIRGATQIHDNGGWGIQAVQSAVSVEPGAMERLHNNGAGGVTGTEGVTLPAGFIVEYNGGPGIVAGVKGDQSLQDIKVRYNQGDGIGLISSGIIAGGQAAGTMSIKGTDSQIVHNGGHGIHALLVNVTIKGATQIHDNGGWGIQAVQSAVTIEQGAMERIHHNGMGGIMGAHGKVRLPAGFAVEDNGGHGIVLIGQNLSLNGVRVSGNQGNGIGIVNGDLSTWGDGVEISGNQGDGINVRSGNLNLNDVEITSNGRYGIWAMQGELLRLTDVYAEHNGLGGIRADRVSLQAHRLLLDGNQGNGLTITGPTTKIQNGRISHNTGYGILGVGTALDMEGVIVYDNALGGVMLLASGSGAVMTGANSLTANAEPSSSIANSTIISNSADGVHFADGASGLVISRSNFLDNNGYALVNAEQDVTVSAVDNWWGPSGDPGALISGAVDYTPWSTHAYSLTAFVTADPVFAPRAVTYTAPVHIQNWEHSAATVLLTATDSAGWLNGPSVMTVTLEEGLGATALLEVLIPEATALGATSWVTASVTSPADPAAADTVVFQIVAALLADLSVAKDGVPVEPLVGEPLTYTLTVANAGPDTASDVVLTDALPSAVTFAAATASQGSCAPQGDALHCALGAMANGSAVTVTVVVTPTAGGALSNTVRVSSPEYDPAPYDNTATVYHTAALPTAPVAVALDGPDSGAPHSFHAFVATVSPTTTTTPITYTWQATGQWWTEQVRTIYSVSDTISLMWHVTGAQTITVTAVNAYGDVVSAVHTIIVEAAPVENHPPVADAGPAQTVAPGDAVTLDGSASSDPDGDPLSYLWQQTGGPAVSFTPTLSRTTFIAPSPGVLTFTLTVTDTGGLSAGAVTTVTVRRYHIYLPLVLRTAP